MIQYHSTVTGKKKTRCSLLPPVRFLERQFLISGRLVFQKIVFFFCELAEYGLDQQGSIWYISRLRFWCIADVSSVSPSSDQTVFN